MEDSRAFDYIDLPAIWAYDIAAGTQAVYEDLLCDIMSNVKEESINKLVFMGGCALNLKQIQKYRICGTTFGLCHLVTQDPLLVLY